MLKVNNLNSVFNVFRIVVVFSKIGFILVYVIVFQDNQLVAYWTVAAPALIYSVINAFIAHAFAATVVKPPETFCSHRLTAGLAFGPAHALSPKRYSTVHRVYVRAGKYRLLRIFLLDHKFDFLLVVVVCDINVNGKSGAVPSFEVVRGFCQGIEQSW